MHISEAAARTGLPAKTIRYYEDIGLLAKPRRAENGYRDYADKDVYRLRFVSRARGLGFTVQECRELLTLYSDQKRESADVKAIALHRIADIDRKIAELQGLRATLAHLAEQCHGDARPDCPILDDLAGSAP